MLENLYKLKFSDRDVRPKHRVVVILCVLCHHYFGIIVYLSTGWVQPLLIDEWPVLIIAIASLVGQDG